MRRPRHDPMHAASAVQPDLFERPAHPPVFVPDALPSQPDCYNICFMLLPPRDKAIAVHAQGEALCRQFNLGTPTVPAGRMHHTLRQVHSCGVQPQEFDQQVIETALHVANGIAWHSLPVLMDSAVGGADAGGHLVLQCAPDSASQIATFGRLLARRLRQNDVPTKAVTPHLTLVYGSRQPVPRQAVPPITWMATAFTLVASHHGLGHHQVLGEWPLATPH